MSDQSKPPIFEGGYNIAVGWGALARCTTGSYNIAIGDGALGDVTSESFQIQLGSIRLPENEPLARMLHAALHDALTGGQPATAIPINAAPQPNSEEWNYARCKDRGTHNERHGACVECGFQAGDFTPLA